MTGARLPERSFAAFLFDMDGTLLTSTGSAERVWAGWARRHGIDVEAFLSTIHGVRAIDTITRWALPGMDVAHEAAAVTQAEIDDLDGIAAIAGAAAFLGTLPEGRWAIVTSAPRALAAVRLRAAGIPIPPVFVTADDISRGKPAPDGYLLAAERLGVAPGDCAVFEDAPAGIQAGEAAGATVIVIRGAFTDPKASHSVLDGYDGVRVAVADGTLRLEAAA